MKAEVIVVPLGCVVVFYFAVFVIFLSNNPEEQEHFGVKGWSPENEHLESMKRECSKLAGKERKFTEEATWEDLDYLRLIAKCARNKKKFIDSLVSSGVGWGERAGLRSRRSSKDNCGQNSTCECKDNGDGSHTLFNCSTVEDFLVIANIDLDKVYLKEAVDAAAKKLNTSQYEYLATNLVNCSIKSIMDFKKDAYDPLAQIWDFRNNPNLVLPDQKSVQDAMIVHLLGIEQFGFKELGKFAIAPCSTFLMNLNGSGLDFLLNKTYDTSSIFYLGDNANKKVDNFTDIPDLQMFLMDSSASQSKKNYATGDFLKNVTKLKKLFIINSTDVVLPKNFLSNLSLKGNLQLDVQISIWNIETGCLDKAGLNGLKSINNLTITDKNRNYLDPSGDVKNCSNYCGGINSPAGDCKSCSDVEKEVCGICVRNHVDKNTAEKKYESVCNLKNQTIIWGPFGKH